MSLKEASNTQYWNTIPKKCKNCIKAIYTKEENKTYYQCSMYGKFKKDCNLKVQERKLPKPEEI